MLKGQKGFTLVELLIVIAILGVLAAVIIPNLVNFTGAADETAANTEADVVRTAVLAYKVEYKAWPETTEDIQEFVMKELQGEYDIEDDGSIKGTGGWDNLAWDDEAGRWEEEEEEEGG